MRPRNLGHRFMGHPFIIPKFMAYVGCKVELFQSHNNTNWQEWLNYNAHEGAFTYVRMYATSCLSRQVWLCTISTPVSLGPSVQIETESLLLSRQPDMDNSLKPHWPADWRRHCPAKGVPILLGRWPPPFFSLILASGSGAGVDCDDGLMSEGSWRRSWWPAEFSDL